MSLRRGLDSLLPATSAETGTVLQELGRLEQRLASLQSSLAALSAQIHALRQRAEQGGCEHASRTAPI